MMTTRTATATPKDLDGSGWYDILEPQPATAALEQNIDTDWLVIGAGFAGCHATRRLLEHDPNAHVVLLEAQDIGFGACGRNSGFMIDLPHELQSHDYSADSKSSVSDIALSRMAIDYVTRCAEEFGLQDSLQRVGKYHGAADDAGSSSLDAFCRGLKNIGEPYTKLDATDMRRITGINYYRSGIHAPGSAMLQPAGYIRGLVRGMNEKFSSLQVYAHSPAQRIEAATKGGAHKVVTPKGTIRAQRIILTVNGHLESFGWHQRNLMHVFTFASMTEKLPATTRAELGGEPAWGLVSAHPMGTTVRRTLDHRIVIRNTFTYNPDMQTTPAQVARLGARHDRSFQQRFGALGNVKMEHRWGGHLCLSRNSVAVFEELETRIYAACCHNGLGTSKGTLGGMLIADYACGHDTSEVKALLQASSPARLPPAFLMTPAAKTYLAVAQWRAGREL